MTSESIGSAFFLLGYTALPYVLHELLFDYFYAYALYNYYHSPLRGFVYNLCINLQEIHVQKFFDAARDDADALITCPGNI